jgi:Mn-containing catalase
LAVIEELDEPLPVPSTFPQSQEQQQYSYSFFVHSNAPVPLDSRFTQGPSLDGNGEFSVFQAQPLGEEPRLAPPPPQAHAKSMIKPQYQDGILTSPTQGQI